MGIRKQKGQGRDEGDNCHHRVTAVLPSWGGRVGHTQGAGGHRVGTAIISVLVCVREAFLEEATSQLGTKGQVGLK